MKTDKCIYKFIDTTEDRIMFVFIIVVYNNMDYYIYIYGYIYYVLVSWLYHIYRIINTIMTIRYLLLVFLLITVPFTQCQQSDSPSLPQLQ